VHTNGQGQRCTIHSEHAQRPWGMAHLQDQHTHCGSIDESRAARDRVVDRSLGLVPNGVAVQ
jgi:hypothetical protein